MQKIFYLSLVFLSASLVSNAQFKQGSLILGGDFNLNMQNSNTPPGAGVSSRSGNLGLSPSIGKAIKENLVLGIALSYSHNYSKNTDTVEPNQSSTDFYGGGIFLREYIPLGNRFYLFAHEQLGGSYGVYSSQGVAYGHVYTAALDIYPGIAYGICKKVQVEMDFQNLASVSYAHQKTGDGTGFDKSDQFAINTSLNNALDNFQLGFRFLL
jgi:hypothetical protein